MINWIYTKSFTDVNIKPTDLEKLPIPNITKEQQEPFIKLVNTIIQAKQKIKKYQKYFEVLSAVEKIEITDKKEQLQQQITTCEQDIDNLVYKLYNITLDEIKIVENINV